MHVDRNVDEADPLPPMPGADDDDEPFRGFSECELEGARPSDKPNRKRKSGTSLALNGQPWRSKRKRKDNFKKDFIYSNF